MATVHPAARDEFCTSLHLAKETTTSGVVLAAATKLSNGSSYSWQNAQSGELTPTKIPAQITQPITLWYFSTKYAQGKSPKVETVQN